MAYGRKDYFWGVAPEKSVFGELQTPVVHTGSNNVNPTKTVTVVTYPVSGGYNFQLTGLTLFCKLPGFQWFNLKVGGASKLIGWFDTERNFIFGEGGNIVCTGANNLTIEFTNYDTVSCLFMGTIYGFLQQIIV
ncbi:unnamed protein product [marine sediment metagenome]|uniref:Uncharacterized protein n=1 Tax=marine sediment metagenome TaxID=412755 RepID=X1DKQ5_9ZZZZ